MQEKMWRHQLNLSLQELPSEEQPEDLFAEEGFYVKYGSVDVSAIRDRIAKEGDTLWTVDGQNSNVRFQRAFHDKLGVNQVIFVFCDDLMKRVYELPWLETWKEELQPIFDAIGLRKTQIIRCLFAKLPIGVEIPVHHDTGLWATKSHRVHVPIITSPQDGPEETEVVFKCGHSELSMRRAPFCEGEITELNNRSKHYVQNNWDKDRIHMIFDYVDDEAGLQRRVLEPGQHVEQSRRAVYIDGEADVDPPSEDIPQLAKEDRIQRGMVLLARVAEHGVLDKDKFIQMCRRYAEGECLESDYVEMLQHALGREGMIKYFHELNLPMLVTDGERRIALQRTFDEMMGCRTFLIIGAMKSGTTSLFEYLVQHPQVLRCRQKEPHFFDWKWTDVHSHKLGNVVARKCEATLEHLKMNGKDNVLQVFASMFPTEDIGMTKIAGEASPSYLVGGSMVAHRVASVLPSNTKLIVIMRDPVKRAWSHYQMTADSNCTPQQRERRGVVDGKSFRQVMEEDLELIRAADELAITNPSQCDTNVLQEHYFDKVPINNGSHSYFSRGMYALQLKRWFHVFPRDNFYFINLDKLSKDVPTEMSKLFAALGLDEFIVENVAPQNTRKYEKLDPETEAWLRELYEPHNRMLVEMLGDEFTF